MFNCIFLERKLVAFTNLKTQMAKCHRARVTAICSLIISVKDVSQISEEKYFLWVWLFIYPNVFINDESVTFVSSNILR